MSKANPPALPPRGRSMIPRVPPPPYSKMTEEKQQQMVMQQWLERDPRPSSMHSLVPEEPARDGKRTLLLIYIHGFMGNETSFQSFPAHVHNLLTMTMAETHAVHSKIYPRYKSKKKINFAVEDFSNWLRPHEDAFTDVILLGHSMGGILEVDVALLPSTSVTSKSSFRHRILGTINFDTPFLGMHPGLVTAGIASLFRPASKMPSATDSFTDVKSSLSQNVAAQSSTSLSTEPNVIPSTSSIMSQPFLSPIQNAISNERPDPNFNAPFANDVKMEKRSGWGNVWHFVNKHMEEGLTSATKQYFVSHLEFGGCLADIGGLKSRYTRVRALEDGQNGQRIRFVNYYSASTGLLKRIKNVSSDGETVNGKSGGPSSSNTASYSANVHAELENLRDNSEIYKAEDSDTDVDSTVSLRHVDGIPIPDSDDEFHDACESSLSASESVLLGVSYEQETTNTGPLPAAAATAIEDDASRLSSLLSDLPPIRDSPIEPPVLDLSICTDKNSKRIAEKEHKSLLKAYRKAVKDRESAIIERQKLLEKREKALKREAEKVEKEIQKKAEKDAKDKEKQNVADLKEQRKQEEQVRKEAESKLSSEEKRLLAEARRVREEAYRMEREAARMRGETLPNPSHTPAESPDNVITRNDNSSCIVKGTRSSQSPPHASSTLETQKSPILASPSKAGKIKKDRKFCLLPSDISGKPDKCWIRVYMEGMDEVGAHCGLFFRGPQYESLVEDVGQRIREWVLENEGTLT